MKLRIRHDAVTVWTTLYTVTFRPRTARTWGIAGLVSLALALATSLSGCSQKSSSPTRSSSPGHSSATTIMVFAAVPLKPAFTLLAGKFQTDNPGATVDFDFATSSELANKLTQGAGADVFASADSAQMDTVTKAGLTGSDPVNFASNTLVIVTAPGDPKQIHSFADLAKPDLHVAVCQSPVPCGAATQRIQDDTGVHINPTSEESTVSGVLTKVTNGEADAGLVYITDARKAGDKVSTVKFPEAADAVNAYPIAILKHASQPALAQKFVDLVIGATGQKVLNQAGFANP
ncbi:MAG: molybdate ABC transporter substrate-binding protein [Mycobacterium sp.]|uniref:molybdate ABC transporter substrate-binding protein n=1 Tax=Mycobacterium sp. TaxID=1785 RepID=UPI003F9D00E1